MLPLTPLPHRRRSRRRAGVVLALALAAALPAAGCGLVAPEAAAAPVVLTLWRHDAEQSETDALDEIVARWNAERGTSTVEVVDVPEGDYGQAVQTAIIAGDLPDLVEVDGPLIASYAYQGALLPLDGHLDDEVVQGLLPSIRSQGTYADQLYAVGMFESGLGLYADRSRLASAGVRVPTGLDDAWSAAELTDALDRLAADDPDGLVLDVKRGYGVGEWLTYGFSPLLWSAGADLVDREDGRAGGTLDSPAAVAALSELQRWAPYVDPDEAGTAFVERDVALSWVGHWEYPRYSEALGDDLVVLPLPDLGEGARSAHGSWAWGVAAGTEHPEEAVAFLEHLLTEESVVTMTQANGAVPGTWAVMQADERFAVGGPLQVYAEALTRSCGPEAVPGCVTATRPQTPGYPTLTYAFAAAVDAVLDGADPAEVLGEAARTVDADHAANEGYRSPPG